MKKFIQFILWLGARSTEAKVAFNVGCDIRNFILNTLFETKIDPIRSIDILSITFELLYLIISDRTVWPLHTSLLFKHVV